MRFLPARSRNSLVFQRPLIMTLHWLIIHQVSEVQPNTLARLPKKSSVMHRALPIRRVWSRSWRSWDVMQDGWPVRQHLHVQKTVMDQILSICRKFRLILINSLSKSKISSRKNPLLWLQYLKESVLQMGVMYANLEVQEIMLMHLAINSWPELQLILQISLQQNVAVRQEL